MLSYLSCQKLQDNTSFEMSHSRYISLELSLRWQSLCTNHALRQNIILVHKTQDSPILYHGSLRNDYKILKKNKKRRLYKAKLLRNKIGIKTGKN